MGFFDQLNHLFDPPYTIYPQSTPIPGTQSRTNSNHQIPEYVMVSVRPSDYSNYTNSYPLPPPPPEFFQSFGSSSYGSSSYSSSSSSDNTRTHGSRTIRVVHGDYDVRDDCGVCAVAAASGKSYKAALSASRAEGFEEDGMTNRQMQNAIRRLGYSADVKTLPQNKFSYLPDLAIITVRPRSELHAVVFFRGNDGEELIFDSRNDGPVPASRYTIADDKIVALR